MPPSLQRASGPHTRRRRAIQAAFLAVFVVLPLFDLLRFDFPGQKLLVFGQEIGLDEWALVWLVLMFAMWVIGAASLVLGRVYCAYACPQTLFTELARDLERLAGRLTRRLPRAARFLTPVPVLALSVAGSALALAYFAPLPEVLGRLARLDAGLWVGAVGVALTVLVFLDLIAVRETFCRSVCPYGLLQGVIEDRRSLHVHFGEEKGPCIDCAACARVCPMGIDIREGSFQIECTRCGSCVDACDTVLARLKPARPGLLCFQMPAGGGWDLKRGLVAASTLGFGAALLAAALLRQPVSFHLSPVYAAGAPAEAAEARFLLRAANRTRQPVTLVARTEGLPADARLSGLEDGWLAPGEERRFTLVVTVPRREVQASVTPFAFVIETPRGARRFPASLLARGRRDS